MANPNHFRNSFLESLLNQLSPVEAARLIHELSSRMTRSQPKQTVPAEKPEETTTGRIRSLLIALGAPTHLYGFGYLVEAIRMCMDDPSLLHKTRLQLYPSLAKKMNATTYSVEHCIRHCIAVAWERQKPGAAYELLGRNVISCYEKPTNSEMIAAIVEKLTRNMD